MVDASKIGTDWTDDELDLIVADYFSMLAEEIAGRSFVKAHRARALMDLTGRTHRSVEFKHMNISAVLSELGLPIIKGYKPKPNYQNAIFEAIDRWLSANPDGLTVNQPANPQIGLAEAMSLYEEPPPALLDSEPERPEGLKRLIRKFDPVERDFRNRALGRAGEVLILEFEQRRLHDGGRKDLAKKVRWIADEEGDGAGYDIRSFSIEGQERFLEVKTTNGPQRTPFFLTRNEEAVSRECQEAYRIYRLYDFVKSARLFTLRPPLSKHVVLEAETFRASFKRKG